MPTDLNKFLKAKYQRQKCFYALCFFNILFTQIKVIFIKDTHMEKAP